MHRDQKNSETIDILFVSSERDFHALLQYLRKSDLKFTRVVRFTGKIKDRNKKKK